MSLCAALLSPDSDRKQRRCCVQTAMRPRRLRYSVAKMDQTIGLPGAGQFDIDQVTPAKAEGARKGAITSPLPCGSLHSLRGFSPR